MHASPSRADGSIHHPCLSSIFPHNQPLTLEAFFEIFANTKIFRLNECLGERIGDDVTTNVTRPCCFFFPLVVCPRRALRTPKEFYHFAISIISTYVRQMTTSRQRTIPIMSFFFIRGKGRVDVPAPMVRSGCLLRQQAQGQMDSRPLLRLAPPFPAPISAQVRPVCAQASVSPCL